MAGSIKVVSYIVMTSDIVPVVIRRDIVVVWFGGSKCLEMVFSFVFISEKLLVLPGWIVGGAGGNLSGVIKNGVLWAVTVFA